MIAGIESISFDEFTQIAKYLDEKNLTRFGKTCKMMNHWVTTLFKRNLIRFKHSDWSLPASIVIRLDRGIIENRTKCIFLELDALQEEGLRGIFKVVQLAIMHPRMPANVCMPFYRSSLGEKVIPCLWVKDHQGEFFVIMNLQAPKESDKKIIENIRTYPKMWTIFQYKRPKNVVGDEYLQANGIIDHYLKT